ncbi:cerebellin-1-like [Eucyclogobius newberryi]|uniref:cerebellin-1-like n=1 Tax=Eucyclogobius newberryi TaxID=166745 RepID=UPI003B59400F
MRVLVYVVFVGGLVLDCAKALEATATTAQLKEAAEKREGDITCQESDCSCVFRSHGCCCGNLELQSLRDQVTETFEDVSGKINQLADEIGQVIEPVNVAFTAFLGENYKCIGPFERNVTIPYDVIYLNEGSGYNSVMGLFTAPVSGVYSFSLSVYSRLQRAGEHMYHKVQLMRNGRAEVSVWEDNAEDMEDSSSHRVLLSLQQGDQVYAELVQDRKLCGNIQGLNSFSGYLVYPMSA